jgi:hypothetical protein
MESGEFKLTLYAIRQKGRAARVVLNSGAVIAACEWGPYYSPNVLTVSADRVVLYDQDGRFMAEVDYADIAEVRRA